MRKITITEAENGYIVTIKNSFENDDDVVDGTMFLVQGDTEGRETMKNLLYQVADLLDETYDKFSASNLNITYDRVGHKAE